MDCSFLVVFFLRIFYEIIAERNGNYYGPKNLKNIETSEKFIEKYCRYCFFVWWTNEGR